MCFACLAWPGRALGQPTNYADEVAVASYVKQMLYWPDAPPAERPSTAFRYKHLLYTNDGGVRAQLESFLTTTATPNEALQPCRSSRPKGPDE